MFKNIKSLIIWAGICLPNYMMGANLESKDNSIVREMSEDEILSWLDILPIDLLDRVVAGKATDNDLQVLANLGKKNCNMQKIEKENFLALIMQYLTIKR